MVLPASHLRARPALDEHANPFGASERDADRRRRRFFTDPRFFIGIAICLVSIVGVWWVLGSASRTTEVLAVRTTLTPGQSVSSGDVNVLEIGSGIDIAKYVTPEQLASGLTATRVVGDGELLPMAAVSTSESAQTTTIVVASGLQVSRDVTTGHRVEVWQAPVVDATTFGTPELLVADAVVVQVLGDEGMLAGSGSRVELVIDRSAVPDVLAAISSKAAISVVPVGGQ